MPRRLPLTALAATVTAALSGSAAAHTGAGAVSGLAAGFAHPFGGLDHMLAMTAVGALAAVIGGRALWLVPSAFIVAMIAGAAMAVGQVGMPVVEPAIIASVVVLGLAVALGVKLRTGAAMVLAAGFAIFHGHAHGSEMPAFNSALGYGAGFLAATAMLHAAGLGLAFGADRLFARSGRVAVRVGGGIVAAAGFVLFLA